MIWSARCGVLQHIYILLISWSLAWLTDLFPFLPCSKENKFASTSWCEEFHPLPCPPLPACDSCRAHPDDTGSDFWSLVCIFFSQSPPLLSERIFLVFPHAFSFRHPGTRRRWLLLPALAFTHKDLHTLQPPHILNTPSSPSRSHPPQPSPCTCPHTDQQEGRPIYCGLFWLEFEDINFVWLFAFYWRRTGVQINLF